MIITISYNIAITAIPTVIFSWQSRQCVPCPVDEMLCPPTTPEGRNDEKALLEQLVSVLSGTDESELAELDRALGIDKLIQVRICKLLPIFFLSPIQFNWFLLNFLEK